MIIRIICALCLIAALNSATDVLSADDQTLFSGRTDYTLCNYPVVNMHVIAGDFNDDGFNDLAVSPVADYGGSWSIAVLLNQGDGTFSMPVRYAADIFPDSLGAADINGDGRLDLLVACHGVSGSPDSLAVLINQGAGVFASPILTTYQLGRGSRQVTAPDIDNDGDADVMVTNGGYYGDPDSSISLFFNDGSGGLSSEVNYPVGESARATAVADVDNDGDKDLVTACYDQEMVWLTRNRGDATFDLPVTVYSLSIGNHSTWVETADFDADGNVDIAAANDFPDTIASLLNSGGGNFPQAVNYGVGELPLAIEVADYNLDSHPDMLTCNHSNAGGVGGGVSLLLNNGDGTFASSRTYSLAPDVLTDFAASDFDGDGDPDIAVVFYHGTWVSVLFNAVYLPCNHGDFNKNGNVDGADLQLFAQHFGRSDGSGDRCTGDLDGDGDVDGKNLSEFLSFM
jgi:hypothetical protein